MIDLNDLRDARAGGGLLGTACRRARAPAHLRVRWTAVAAWRLRACLPDAEWAQKL